MHDEPRQISLADWDARHAALTAAGLREPWYGGHLGRHVEDGDFRLLHLRFDNSPAALRLWNFLLTEEDRLHRAREQGLKIVGAMKDLGTVPVIAFASPRLVAFYPDGAWWIPCVMECSENSLELAADAGIDESFCPVRAMLGAFLNQEHFPMPDLLVCSAGATCDDFSAIAQRLESLGFPILWWEIPYRRRPDADEHVIELPGGFRAPAALVEAVKSELGRVTRALEQLDGAPLDDAALAAGIREANTVRRLLHDIRHAVFTAPRAPLPALELLVAEMFALHFCSDRAECIAVLEDLHAEVRARVQRGAGYGDANAIRVFWVNPTADLRVMNLFEECGGRLCGTDFLFAHALDVIPENIPPLDALARMALADPMVGPATDRAARICTDAARFGAEAVAISRIPGASHCATESADIADAVRATLGLPVVDIEIPPLIEPLMPTVRTRLEALVETAREKRTA